MAKKINGYLKWAAIMITLLGIFAGTIWNAATLHNDVAHLRDKVDSIETLLIEHISKHH
jgi:hypothetical protein